MLVITETKSSLMDKTGRFCSMQIRRFCVYMRARSRIMLERYDEALSILLPEKLEDIYTPEISESIRTHTCFHLKRIHDERIIQLLELILFVDLGVFYDA